VIARRWAAGVLRETLDAQVAAGNDEATQREVAERLEVSHTQVQRWCGDGAPAITLGDVRAMGDDIARAVFSAALADCTPPHEGGSACPQAIALATLEHVGRLAATAKAVLADGRVTKGEWGDVDAVLAELEVYLCHARSAVRAERKRGGR